MGIFKAFTLVQGTFPEKLRKADSPMVARQCRFDIILELAEYLTAHCFLGRQFVFQNVSAMSPAAHRPVRVGNCAGAACDAGYQMYRQCIGGPIDVVTGDYLAGR